MRSYEEYRKELKDEIKKKKLLADELDDVEGGLPEPMDEKWMMEVLQGHKFKFTLENHQQYLHDSRSILEQILKCQDFDIHKCLETITKHF